ncbi:MAG: hypothetical protein RL216_1257 [Pseudomonadota bacterium]|jgi:hypothetical protein
MRPLLTLLLLLAACASPSPQFFDAQRSDVVVQGRSYIVFRDANRVQVIRLGYATPTQRRDIPAQMLRAVTLATGCTPIAASFQGDSGERRGRITC